MLRPEEMTRVVIVGSIEGIDNTVECLYDMGALHLIDFTKQDEDFRLGKPLSHASDASQKLVKLRSMIRSLDLEEVKPKKKFSVSEIESRLEQAIITLDLNTGGKVESRQRIQSVIREKESEITSLQPVRSFGIPLEIYDGLENVSSLVGVCRDDPEADLSGRIKQMELFKEVRKDSVSIALFVPNEEKATVVKILTAHGFSEAKVPKLKGMPEDIIKEDQQEIKDLETDLKRLDADLDKIRKDFADFIVASEETLSIEVVKAETPLRFAESENSFVVDGWVPNSMWPELQAAIEQKCCGVVYAEALHPESQEETPVKLKNPKPVKPFEFFINLVSTPKYEEIDPTFILFITFPLFFGFMLGDLGFGAGLAALGAVIRWKMKDSPDLRKLGTIILAGGLVACVFGVFVYCEAFGVPFHPPSNNPDEASWENVAYIPLHPLIEKMQNVLELLALSFLAGWVHLTVGFIFGFFNKIHHSRKHALGKIAWLLILLGIFTELMTMGGNATQTSKFLNSTVLAPLMPHSTILLAGIKTAYSALVLVVVGIGSLLVTEGAGALTEVIGLFSNLISYARMAALGVGKGAMAFAFNSMLFPLIFHGGPGIAGILIAVAGIAALVVVQLFFVFFLGSLSVGIQAMRLNYVEFFLKFFEGGGTDFKPLSYERKYSSTT